MGEYISAAGPHFWALSSSAQSHLQEMRVRRVLMSDSGPLRVNSERNVLLLNAFMIRIIDSRLIKKFRTILKCFM
jgi:hypothetical protein